MALPAIHIYGSEACAVRTKAAAVLSIQAALSGRRVLLVENASHNLQLMLPAPLIGKRDGALFVVSGIPDERLVIALSNNGNNVSAAQLKKIGRDRDMLILSHGKAPATSELQNQQHKILVGGIDGLMLTQMIAVASQIGNVNLTIAAVAENKIKLYDKMLERAKKKFAAVDDAITMQLLSYTAFNLPERDDEQLWETSARILSKINCAKPAKRSGTKTSSVLSDALPTDSSKHSGISVQPELPAENTIAASDIPTPWIDKADQQARKEASKKAKEASENAAQESESQDEQSVDELADKPETDIQASEKQDEQPTEKLTDEHADKPEADIQASEKQDEQSTEKLTDELADKPEDDIQATEKQVEQFTAKDSDQPTEDTQETAKATPELADIDQTDTEKRPEPVETVDSSITDSEQSDKPAADQKPTKAKAKPDAPKTKPAKIKREPSEKKPKFALPSQPATIGNSQEAAARIRKFINLLEIRNHLDLDNIEKFLEPVDKKEHHFPLPSYESQELISEFRALCAWYNKLPLSSRKNGGATYAAVAAFLLAERSVREDNLTFTPITSQFVAEVFTSYQPDDELLIKLWFMATVRTVEFLISEKKYHEITGLLTPLIDTLYRRKSAFADQPQYHLLLAAISHLSVKFEELSDNSDAATIKALQEIYTTNCDQLQPQLVAAITKDIDNDPATKLSDQVEAAKEAFGPMAASKKDSSDRKA